MNYKIFARKYLHLAVQIVFQNLAGRRGPSVLPHFKRAEYGLLRDVAEPFFRLEEHAAGAEGADALFTVIQPAETAPSVSHAFHHSLRFAAAAKVLRMNIPLVAIYRWLKSSLRSMPIL